MGSSVNTVLYNAMGDGSRPTNYRVIASVPYKVLGATTSIQDLDVLAKNFSIPAISHKPLEVIVHNHPIPLPNKTNFGQEFTITFYSDEKHRTRKLFLDWIRALDPTIVAMKDNEYFDNDILNDLVGINPLGGLMDFLSLDSDSDLLTTIKLQVMDFDNELVNAEYKFFGAFPLVVDGVNFDGSSVSQTQEFSVTFRCHSYELSTGNGLYDVMDAAIDKTLDLGSSLVSYTSKAIKNSLLGDGDKFEEKGIS